MEGKSTDINMSGDPSENPPSAEDITLKKKQLVRNLYEKLCIAKKLPDLSTLSELHTTTVSAINQCVTLEVKHLCIYDVALKLSQDAEHNVGKGEIKHAAGIASFWFVIKTANSRMSHRLLSLYVYTNRHSKFTIGISDGLNLFFDEMPKNTDVLNPVYGKAVFSNDLMWQSFNCAEKDELFYVHTFSFNEDQLKSLEKRLLYIPIRIQIDDEGLIEQMQIKMDSDVSSLLKSSNDDKDFQIITPSGNVFHMHKAVLAARSPVFRELIRNNTYNLAVIDNVTDDDMDILYEYFYTGNIKTMDHHVIGRVLYLAQRFQVVSLITIAEIYLSKQINLGNAADIGLLAEQYNLTMLQDKILEYVRQSASVIKLSYLEHILKV